MSDKQPFQRIHYIDIAKGILIILMIFAHFRSVLSRLPYDSDYFRYVYGWNRFFVCFFMPAFFLISGYCSDFSKPLKIFLVSLTKTLVIPLVTLSIIGGIFEDIIFYHKGLNVTLVKIIKQGGVLWFIQALIICKLISYFALKLTNSLKILFAISFVLLVGGVALDNYQVGPNIFSYKNAFVATVFVPIGVFLNRNQNVFQKVIRLSLFVYPPLAILTLFFNPPFLVSDIGISLINIPVFLIYSISGTLFLIELSRRISTCSWLEYWGRNTIIVYGLHFGPYIFLFRMLYDLILPNSVGLFVLFVILLFAFEYGTCYLLMKLFEVKPFKWLIGRI